MIREMIINDYEEVIDLWKKTEGVGLSESDSKQHIQNFLNRNKGLSNVYIKNDIVVGTVLCGHDGRRGYIHHLAVDEKYRGNKIGSDLISTCLEELKKDGILKCHLFVFNENELGKSFWKGTGWSLRDDLLIFSKICM